MSYRLSDADFRRILEAQAEWWHRSVPWQAVNPSVQAALLADILTTP